MGPETRTVLITSTIIDLDNVKEENQHTYTHNKINELTLLSGQGTESEQIHEVELV